MPRIPRDILIKRRPANFYEINKTHRITDDKPIYTKSYRYLIHKTKLQTQVKKNQKIISPSYSPIWEYRKIQMQVDNKNGIFTKIYSKFCRINEILHKMLKEEFVNKP